MVIKSQRLDTALRRVAARHTHATIESGFTKRRGLLREVISNALAIMLLAVQDEITNPPKCAHAHVRQRAANLHPVLLVKTLRDSQFRWRKTRAGYVVLRDGFVA